MSKIELRKVVKQYGAVTVVHGVDMELPHGELTVFVGPSGCGKSTLLRMIAGLEEISGGDILIDGIRVNDLPPSRRGVAMVFQSYALYPHMTVRENIGFGLTIARMPKAELDKRVEEVANILQITDLLNRKPKELSGGQRQRVAIGRAITRSPGAYLFDEPLSNLDAALRVQMRMEISKLHGSIDASMIYVTHDQIEAMTLADRIVVLRDGRIEQIGAPEELYESPANTFVAQFIGSPSMNLMACECIEGSDQTVLLKLDDGSQLNASQMGRRIKVGQQLIAGVRPEHLTPTSNPEYSIEGGVGLIERLGGEVHLHITARNGSALTGRHEGNLPGVNTGDKMFFQPKPDLVYVFDQDGLFIQKS